MSPPLVASAGQAWRFSSGVGRFVRHPLDADAVTRAVAGEMATRDARLLASLDALVWPYGGSPFRRLLAHAGYAADDVRALVRAAGAEGALAQLRDDGVYISYEEATGDAPVVRGSLRLDVGPRSFFNPRVPADFIAGTSASRSAGIPVSASFRSLRRMAANLVLTKVVWDVVGAPSALWRPALPASGGLIAALASTAAGSPPERWFSQTDPGGAEVAVRKRVANAAVPAIARLVGAPLPRATYVPTSDPAPVLEWCAGALARSGRAALNVYPSSAVHLAALAERRGVRLHGLVARLVGEPVSGAKASALRAAGMAPVNAYAFAQQGAVATACPACDDEELHVFDHEIAVVPRRRARPDGVDVDAFLWTSLSLDTRSVWLNVENDDYGDIGRDDVACTCRLGTLGMRTRLRRVRGMTKTVAGGVTLPGSAIEELVERILPGRFGGGPGDWQLVERERAGATVVAVRAAPSLGALDEAAVVDCVLSFLGRTEAGALAARVWQPSGALTVERLHPITTSAGKCLPYERASAP